MIIDILVLIVLLISAGIAFMRGFIREVLTIAGVVGGLAASYYGGPHLKPHMYGWFGIEEGVEPERLFDILPYDILADVLSYAAIFIVVVAILSFVSHSLAEFARKVGLGAVDRSLGFLFGLFRAVVLLGLIYLLPYTFIDKESRDGFMEESKSQIYLEYVAKVMSGFLPENVEEQANEVLKQGEGALDARKTLEEIDLLKRDEEPAPNESNSDNGDGYNDQFRDKMNQLIDQNSGLSDP
ncbi:MAG: CvpA family protein [Bdellovibrionales bacterium]